MVQQARYAHHVGTVRDERGGQSGFCRSRGSSRRHRRHREQSHIDQERGSRCAAESRTGTDGVAGGTRGASGGEVGAGRTRRHRHTRSGQAQHPEVGILATFKARGGALIMRVGRVSHIADTTRGGRVSNDGRKRSRRRHAAPSSACSVHFTPRRCAALTRVEDPELAGVPEQLELANS